MQRDYHSLNYNHMPHLISQQTISWEQITRY